MNMHENVFHKSKIVQYLKELIQLYDIQSLATLDCIECLCRSDLRCLRMAAEIYKCIKNTLNSFEICLHKPDLDWTKFTYTCTLKNVHRKRYLYLSFLGLSCYAPGTYEPRVLHVLEDAQTFNRQKRLFEILESCKELHNLNPDIDDYSHIITYVNVFLNCILFCQNLLISIMIYQNTLAPASPCYPLYPRATLHFTKDTLTSTTNAFGPQSNLLLTMTS